MTEQDRSLQILLVEDNPVDVLVTREALAGWDVKSSLHVVEDGQEALDFLRRQGDFIGAAQPDLVLLDLNLPKKNGREILAEIKQDPDLSTITVVVVTTSDSTTDVQTCRDLGANLYIIKPQEFEEYVEALNSIQEIWLNSE